MLGKTASVAGEHLLSLGALSRAIGAEIVQLVESPAGEGLVVTGSVLYDRHASPVSYPGGVALAIGLSLSGKRLLAQLQELKDARYVALVYKAHGEPDGALRRAARSMGVALLRVSDSVPWDQLAEIMNTAIALHGESARTLVDIRPGDLFDLANTVASLAGGAVAIADPAQTLLAYSTLPGQPIDDTRRCSILQLHVPRTDENDSDYRRVHASHDVIRFAFTEPSLTRAAIAIRAGDVVLGSLWLIDAHMPDGTDADRVLREAAEVAALHILHRRTTYVSNLSRQIDLVRPLLFESERAELSAVQLGISTASVRVAALTTWGPSGSAPDELQSSFRLFDLMRTACAVRLPSAVCGLADNIVYVVLPEPATTEGEGLFQREVLLKIVQNAGRLLSRPVLAGVGMSAPIAALETSRTDAEEVLAVLLRDVDEGRILVDSDEVVADRQTLGPRLYLRQMVAVLRSSGFLPGAYITRIAAHDALRKTSFEETLRVYLDQGGNAIEASAKLGLHVNTVRYRLSRVEPLFGLKLDDPETRLLLWLQLWASSN